MTGDLYVVATPIGNLGDISFRAAETLRSVDLVMAENRSRALKLLSHLGIKKRIETVTARDEERKTGMIVRFLSQGRSCALISGAGTPGISDPGAVVVRGCLDAGVAVHLVPGPSAASGAVSVAGLTSGRFLFYGFFPQKKMKKRRLLREFSSFPYPVVFFESPGRLEETLAIIREELGERRLVICKELTKIHEEVLTGTVSDVLEMVSGDDDDVKGEYVIIVECRETEG